jgi:hypothetical protein
VSRGWRGEDTAPVPPVSLASRRRSTLARIPDPEFLGIVRRPGQRPLSTAPELPEVGDSSERNSEARARANSNVCGRWVYGSRRCAGGAAKMTQVQPDGCTWNAGMHTSGSRWPPILAPVPLDPPRRERRGGLTTPGALASWFVPRRPDDRSWERRMAERRPAPCGAPGAIRGLCGGDGGAVAGDAVGEMRMETQRQSGAALRPARRGRRAPLPQSCSPRPYGTARDELAPETTCPFTITRARCCCSCSRSRWAF